MTRPTAIRLLGLALVLVLGLLVAGAGHAADAPAPAQAGLSIQSTILGATGIVTVVIGLVKVITEMMDKQAAREAQAHELALAKVAASRAEVEERVRKEQAAEAGRLATLKASVDESSLPMGRVDDKRVLKAVHLGIEAALPDMLAQAKAAGAAGAVEAATAARRDAERRADEQHTRVNQRADALRAELTREVTRVEVKVDKNVSDIHALEGTGASLRLLLEEIKGLVRSQNADIKALNQRVSDMRDDMRREP